MNEINCSQFLLQAVVERTRNLLHVSSHLIMQIRLWSAAFSFFPSCEFFSCTICDFLLSFRLLIMATMSLITQAVVQQKQRQEAVFCRIQFCKSIVEKYRSKYWIHYIMKGKTARLCSCTQTLPRRHWMLFLHAPFCRWVTGKLMQRLMGLLPQQVM